MKKYKLTKKNSYLIHLFTWTRLKATAWTFLAGTLATALYNLNSSNLLTVTWTDVKIVLVTAVASQITKALSNYADAQAI